MLKNKFLIECKNGDDWLGFGCSASIADALGGVGGALWKTVGKFKHQSWIIFLFIEKN